MGLSSVITQSRQTQPQLVDGDVIATLDALIQTFETLDKGIYYESTPASSIQKSLYLALKLFLEGPAERQLIDQCSRRYPLDPASR